MAIAQPSINDTNYSILPSMLHLLKSGFKNKVESDIPKNVALILGFTGSYKSDLIQLVTEKKQSSSNRSNPTSSSITFPSLVVDSKTNTAYYDCPEFDSSKTLDEELSTEYLLKKIIDYADSIKLIFTIPESRIKPGLDDEQINALLNHSMKLIENINKIKDSIALIVTKVDNFIDDKRNIVSDDNAIINNIAANLMDTLKKYSTSNENFSKHKKMLILNILLRKKDGMYTNIGIFKKPEKFVGQISANKVFRDNEKSLKMVINVNTKFTTNDKNNFRYSISTDISPDSTSRFDNYFLTLDNDAKFSISNDIREIGQNMIKYYESLPLQNIDRMHQKIEFGILFLQSLLYHTRIQDFAMQLKDLTYIPQKYIASIDNYAKYISFVKTLTEKSGHFYFTFPWLHKFLHSIGLEAIIRNLEGSRDWYSFLREFYSVLSSYKVLEARKSNEYRATLNNNLQKLRSQTTAWRENIRSKEYNDIKQNIVMAVENIFKSLKINDGYHIMYSRLIQASISQAKLRLLSDMLDSLFFVSSDDTHISCLNGTLKIQGQFVKLSDVSKEEDKKCDKKMSVKTIELFASNRIYIDDNFDKTGNEVSITIIAPTWEVVGERKIILDGKAGKDHENITAPFTDSSPGSDGNDGKPGKPGGPAGTFLGIGMHFLNGNFLVISASGGRGGRGQNGSNGFDGDYLKKTVECNGTEVVNFNRMCSRLDETNYHCIDDTLECVNGGNGGRGGAGGKGGKAGEIKIIELSGFPSHIEKFITEGEIGFNGEPGLGGKGGVKEILNFNVSQTSVRTMLRTYRKHKFDKIETSYEKCAQGISDTNSFNQEDIEPPTFSGIHISANAISDYKSYLRDLIVRFQRKNEKFRDDSLREFLYLIEKPLNREAMPYSAIEFTHELKNLETQFYQLRRELSFLPFYEALLDRISKHANEVYSEKNSNKYNNDYYNGENNDDRKKHLEDETKALRYLYTATLSKIISIRDNKSSNLILNIDSYLESVLENVEKLSDYKKITIMNKVQEDYHKSINADIKKATESVLRIKNKIDSDFEKMDEDIKLLIKETMLLKRKVENQINNLETMDKNLRNAIMIRSYLTVPKMIAHFLNFVGPIGKAAGEAISGSIMVMESLSVSDTSKDNIKAADLPGTFSKEMSNIEKLFDDEQALVQMQLKVIEEEFKNTTKQASSPPPIVLQVQSTISNITRAVEEGRIKGVFPNSMSETTAKVTAILEKLATELGDEKYKNDTVVQTWSKSMNRAVNLFSVVQLDMSMYKDIAGDYEKVELVARAIKESKGQLKKLDAYKQNIYKNTLPQCRELQKHLRKLSEDTNRERSLDILDISKWEMQGMLNDFKYSMRNMTQGFTVQEDITRLVDDLGYALTTMINVYDRIQDYHDKKILADYIANINPTSSDTDTGIQNRILKNDVDNLKLTIQSNIVVEEYERAIYAVKQTVYPRAHDFLAEYHLPFDSKSGNIISLTMSATHMLNKLRRKIKNPGKIPFKYNWYNYANHNFNVDDEIRGAFYIWKYDENKHAIARLLRGQKVTLNSDITKSTPKFSAVKFRHVVINFIVADKTVENQFKEELKHFVLEMVHLGNSHYRCIDKFHVITNSEVRLTVEYSTSRGNDVTDMLNGSDPLLSPYALWNIQLISNNNRGFALLRKFQNMTIDLALEGVGSYHHNSDPDMIEICNDENLSKYYKEDKTILEMNSGMEPHTRDVLEESPGLVSHIEDQQNHPRKRRSLDDREFERDVDDDTFATSGAFSNMKSSLINNIFNLLGTGLVAHEYLNPFYKISQWFTKYKTNLERFVVMTDNIVTTDIKMLNHQSSTTESPKVPKMFIDEESPTVNNLFNNPSFYTHGNLLLLDLLIRSKSGVKHSRERLSVINTNVDPEFTHHLAYREYAK